MTQESVHEYAPAKRLETQADKIGFHRDCLNEFAKNATPEEAEALFNLIWSVSFDLSNLRSQSVPLAKMGALYNEVQFWETIRHAKMTEQGAVS